MNPTHLRKQRVGLRLSQSALARLADVPRVHICLHELGDRPLKPTEIARVEAALRKEAMRLRQVSQTIANPLVTRFQAKEPAEP